MQGQTAFWFESYLKDRQQFCAMNGVSSAKNRIICGVPQGSLLGPLLFLIYITDLPNCLEHSLGRSFADDTNVTLSAEDLPTLQTEMSHDLNRMFDMLNSNKLPLNILKTDFMVIGPRQRIATLLGKQCWRSAESTGLPPMWPGFDSRIGRHMCVEFVGSLHCCERFFPGYSGFPLSPQTNIWFVLIWFPVSPISRASVLG